MSAPGHRPTVFNLRAMRPIATQTADQREVSAATAAKPASPAPPNSGKQTYFAFGFLICHDNITPEFGGVFDTGDLAREPGQIVDPSTTGMGCWRGRGIWSIGSFCDVGAWGRSGRSVILKRPRPSGRSVRPIPARHGPNQHHPQRSRPLLPTKGQVQPDRRRLGRPPRLPTTMTFSPPFELPVRQRKQADFRVEGTGLQSPMKTGSHGESYRNRLC